MRKHWEQEYRDKTYLNVKYNLGNKSEKLLQGKTLIFVGGLVTIIILGCIVEAWF